MEINSRDDIKDLSLQELKIICKSYRISVGGTRPQLIKRIWEHVKPEPVVIHSHPASVSPEGKKIVGAKTTDTDKLRQIGQQVEKKQAHFIYYSMGGLYFEVNKEFEFL